MREEPHVCPKCEGMKKFEGKDCPTCEGTGVVWKVDAPKAGDTFQKQQETSRWNH